MKNSLQAFKSQYPVWILGFKPKTFSWFMLSQAATPHVSSLLAGKCNNNLLVLRLNKENFCPGCCANSCFSSLDSACCITALSVRYSALRSKHFNSFIAHYKWRLEAGALINITPREELSLEVDPLVWTQPWSWPSWLCVSCFCLDLRVPKVWNIRTSYCTSNFESILIICPTSEFAPFQSFCCLKLHFFYKTW